MYLYLGNERVVVGEWIVDVISFHKIFGLCDLKCHRVEIWKYEYRARIREAGFAIRHVPADISNQVMANSL